MIKTVKSFATIFVLAGFLAACSSNNQIEEPVATPEPTPTPVVETYQPAEPVDPSANVTKIFYFEFDESILTSEARAALTVHAEALRSNPQSVRLEGHADERGSREYNMALGERRANAVKDFLVLQGVSGSNIETVSYGEERPVETGSYESAWSANRRVELVK